jgi:hypothetical protein
VEGDELMKKRRKNKNKKQREKRMIKEQTCGRNS